MNGLSHGVFEAPGWDYDARLEGRCRHCGADLSGVMHVRATVEWVNRYHTDGAFHRKVNQGLERIAMRRHERECPGALAQQAPETGWTLPQIERSRTERPGVERSLEGVAERPLATGAARW